MSEFKTLLECYKEAGEKFPFDIQINGSPKIRIVLARSKRAGDFFIEEFDGGSAIWPQNHLAKLIKPEPPKKYLWQIELNNDSKPFVSQNFLAENDAKKLWPDAKLTPFLEMR